MDLEALNDRTHGQRADSRRFTGDFATAASWWALIHTVELLPLEEYVNVEIERGGIQLDVWSMIPVDVELFLVRIVHSYEVKPATLYAARSSFEKCVLLPFSPGFLWVIIV